MRIDGTARALRTIQSLLTVHTKKFGDMAVIEYEGRIVRSEAALKLREAVNSQRDARIIVLDLSEVPAIEGGGLGMLVFLERGAHDHDLRLKLFNPRQSVRSRLQRTSSMRKFDMATPDEMMALLARADSRYAQAALTPSSRNCCAGGCSDLDQRSKNALPVCYSPEHTSWHLNARLARCSYTKHTEESQVFEAVVSFVQPHVESKGSV